jgi:hypothetical protein
MNISDASEGTVAAVVDRLLPLYKEYQMERREVLQATVKEALLIITRVNAVPKPPATLSLNQSMTNLYSKGGSKRSRPDEQEVTDTEVDISKMDKPTVPPPAAEGPSKSGSTPKKKKAVSFKGSESGSTVVNGMQVDTCYQCVLLPCH